MTHPFWGQDWVTSDQPDRKTMNRGPGKASALLTIGATLVVARAVDIETLSRVFRVRVDGSQPLIRR